jgi:curli biogenesis system outer membrane secretion channel CsgG
MTKTSKSKIIVFLFLFVALGIEAKIVYVDVTVTGIDNSLNGAINNGLAQAIAQIHGKSIDSITMLRELEMTVHVNDSEAYLSSSLLMSQIATKTQGTVSSYQIINKSDDESGLWSVTITAQVAKYDPGLRGNRKRIALVPTKSKKSAYRLASENISSIEISQKLSADLSRYLVQTRKFAILDRKNQSDIKSELDLAKSDRVPVAEIARIGNTLIADYVLVTDIHEFHYQRVERTSKLSGRIFYTGTGIASINYSLIDSASSEIVLSNTISQQISMEDLATSGASSTASAAANKLSELSAKQLSSQILQQIYPIAVVQVDTNKVILSQGGNGLTPGDQYHLFLLGNKLIDPYTKESLGREETEIGILEITRVNAKQSYADVISSTVDLEKVFAPKRLVLRDKVSLSTPSNTEILKKVKTERKEKLAKDDDW